MSDIDLKSVRDRLRAQCGSLRQVGVAASLAAALEGRARAWPCAFVIRAAERAQPASLDGAVDQQVDTRIAVALGVKVATVDQDAAGDELDECRREVINALFGWSPAGAEDALGFAGSQILTLGDGRAWLSIDFTTVWRLM